MPKKKLWGGAFAEPLDPQVLAYGDSTRYEDRLVPHDIAGSLAHARMLGKVGLLSKAECARLVRGLQAVLRDWEKGSFKLSPAYEDVHGNVEARLRAKLGPLAGKLHSGRSRNDQVALDEKLWLRAAAKAMRQEVAAAATGLLNFAKAHGELVLPGYTHLQRAQPVLLGHWALAYVEMLLRDAERLKALEATASEECPLGAAALAGSSLPLDRAYVARLLGFQRPSENSLDTVSNRDHLIEHALALSLISAHLSRLGEDVVLYCSQEFGFFRLDDAVATGSSLMPQKRNPDVAELMRGRAGRAYGLLMHLLTLVKGQALAYNRDMQEDKELLFQTDDVVRQSLAVLPVLIAGLQPQAARMQDACSQGFLDATDAADWFVGQGVPFREAHEAVGLAVRACQLRGCGLTALPLAAWQKIHPKAAAGLFKALELGVVVASRQTFGGTAPKRFRQALLRAVARVKKASV